jgi:O-acetyl-ADP-ribose deacetylase (regulator of RNase III)
MSKIKLIVGDVTEFPNKIEAIFQGCNTLNVMGAGLAKQLAKKYPCVLGTDKIFHKYWKRNSLSVSMLGSFSFCAVDAFPHLVFNLYQQDRIGRCALNYDALKESMSNAMAYCEKLGLERVGIPFKIGCGLAGGDWEVVMETIAEASKKFSGETFIVQRITDIN